MKKVISVLLSVLICINTLPVQIIAEDENTIEEVKEEIVEVVEDKQEETTQQQETETSEETLVVEQNQEDTTDQTETKEDEVIIEEEIKEEEKQETEEEINKKEEYNNFEKAQLNLYASTTPLKANLLGETQYDFDLKYNGNSISFTVSDKFSYKYYKESSAETSGIVNITASNLNKTVTLKPIKAGETKINITAYNGALKSESKEFMVIVRPLEITEVEISPNTFKYDGNGKMPSLTVKAGELTLESTDYDVVIKDSNNTTVDSAITEGDYTLVVKGKGNFSGEKSSEVFNITDKKPISDCDIVITPNEYTYDRNTTVNVTDKIVVKDKDSNVLEEGKDYEIVTAESVLSAKKAGEYPVVISGLGEWKGTTSTSWKINKATPTNEYLTGVIAEYKGQNNNIDLVEPVDNEINFKYYTSLTGKIESSLIFNNTVNITSSSIPTDDRIGEHYVYWACDESENYKAVSKNINNYVVGKINKIDLSKATITLNSNTFTYNAEQQVPSSITSAVSQTGHDLTIDGLKITVTKQTNVGEYEATINPTSHNLTDYNNYYTNSKTIKWNITPKEIGIEWSNLTVTYNKESQKPTATPKDVISGDTVTLTVTTNPAESINAGTYTATASLTNTNYLLKESDNNKEFKINPSADITALLNIDKYPYNDGNPITPTYTVTSKLDTLVKDRDYTLSEDVSKSDIGKYNLKITGVGNYTGVFNLPWEITAGKQDLTLSDISIETLTYNGENQKPIIKVDSEEINSNSDYEITYGSDTSIDADTYDVQIKVKDSNAYYNEATLNTTYTINPASFTLDDSYTKTFTYNGENQKPSIVVKGVKDATLTEGEDYTVNWPDDYKDAGNYSATVTGQGNYTGTANVSWTINPKEIGIEWSNLTVTYNKESQKPTATPKDVISGDTVTLTVTTNPAESINAGTYTATASLTNTNYLLKESDNNKEFTINKVVVSVPTKIDNLVYDGTSKTGVLVDDNLYGENKVYKLSSGKISETNAGSYSAKFALNNTTNYKWDVNYWDTNDQTVYWSISKADPKVDGKTITYDGDEHQLFTAYMDDVVAYQYHIDDGATIPDYTKNKFSFDIPKATNSGTYNYYWFANVTSYTGDIGKNSNFEEVDWQQYGTKKGKVTATIQAASFTLDDSYTKTFTYNGENQKPSIVVKGVKDATLTEGEDYTVNWPDDYKDAGNYSATVTGQGNYTGTANVSWTINHASVTPPSVKPGTLTYNKQEQTGVVANDLGTLYEIKDGVIEATDAGTYNVEFLLIDDTNYAWKDTFDGKLSWTIDKAEIDSVELDRSIFIWSDNETQGPTLTVKAGDLPLTETDDYKVTGDYEAVDINEYTLKVESNSDNITGSIEKTWSIVAPAKNLQNAEIVFDPTSYDYTGEDIDVSDAFIVMYDGEPLTLNEDYTVDGDSKLIEKNAGTYTITINPVDPWTNTQTGTWTIKKINTPAPKAETLTFNNDDQSLVSVDDSSYKYKYYVTDQNHIDDFGSVSFVDEIPTGKDAGTYYVYWTAQGDTNHLEMSASNDNVVEVTISPATLTSDDISFSNSDIDGYKYNYTGNEITPVIVVNKFETTLTLDSDYTVTSNVAKITRANNYSVTIEGKGNYTGSANKTWAIVTDYDLSKATVTYKPAQAYKYNEENQTVLASDFEVVYDGETLTTDCYEITSGATAKTVDSHAVILSGKSPWTNTLNSSWSIEKGNTPAIEANTLIYNGESQTLVTPGTQENVGYSYFLYAVGNKPFDSDIELNTAIIADNLIGGGWKSTPSSYTNSGKYYVYYKAAGNDNYEAISQSYKNYVTVTISPIDLSNAEITLDANSFEYNGSYQRPEIQSVVVNGFNVPSTAYNENISSKKDVRDDYTVTISSKLTNNNYINSKTIYWSITPKQLDVSWVGNSFEYNGEEQKPTASVTTGVGKETVDVTVTPDKESKNVGNYVATASITNTNYSLSSATTTHDYSIYAKAIDVPTANSDLVFDGDEKTGVSTGEGYTLEDNTATNAGDYEATATLSSNNYVWGGGSNDPQKIAWSIAKATIDTVEVSSSSYKFDNTKKTPTITKVKAGNLPLDKSEYKIVEESSTLSATSVGNYEIVVESDSTNFKGTATGKWAIVPDITINVADTDETSERSVDYEITGEGKIAVKATPKDGYYIEKIEVKDITATKEEKKLFTAKDDSLSLSYDNDAVASGEFTIPSGTEKADYEIDVTTESISSKATPSIVYINNELTPVTEQDVFESVVNGDFDYTKFDTKYDASSNNYQAIGYTPSKGEHSFGSQNSEVIKITGKAGKFAKITLTANLGIDDDRKDVTIESNQTPIKILLGSDKTLLQEVISHITIKDDNGELGYDYSSDISIKDNKQLSDLNNSLDEAVSITVQYAGKYDETDGKYNSAELNINVVYSTENIVVQEGITKDSKLTDGKLKLIAKTTDSNKYIKNIKADDVVISNPSYDAEVSLYLRNRTTSVYYEAPNADTHTITSELVTIFDTTGKDNVLDYIKGERNTTSDLSTLKQAILNSVVTTDISISDLTFKYDQDSDLIPDWADLNSSAFGLSNHKFGEKTQEKIKISYEKLSISGGDPRFVHVPDLIVTITLHDKDLDLITLAIDPNDNTAGAIEFGESHLETYNVKAIAASDYYVSTFTVDNVAVDSSDITWKREVAVKFLSLDLERTAYVTLNKDGNEHTVVAVLRRPFEYKTIRELAYINNITNYTKSELEAKILEAIIDTTEIPTTDIKVEYYVYNENNIEAGWQAVDHSPVLSSAHKFGDKPIERIRLSYTGNDDKFKGLTSETNVTIIDDRLSTHFVVPVDEEGNIIPVKINASDLDKETPNYTDLKDVIIKNIPLVDANNDSVYDAYEAYTSETLDIKNDLTITYNGEPINNIFDLPKEQNVTLLVTYGGKYLDGLKYKPTESTSIVVNYTRYVTSMNFDRSSILITYDPDGVNLANVIKGENFVVVYNMDKEIIEPITFNIDSEISWNPKVLDATLIKASEVKVDYTGNDLYQPCSNTLDVRVLPASSNISFDVISKTFDNKPIEIDISTTPANIRKAYMIAGLEGDAEGYVSLYLDTSSMTYVVYKETGTFIDNIVGPVISNLIENNEYFGKYYDRDTYTINYGDALVDVINSAFENDRISDITKIINDIVDAAEKSHIETNFEGIEGLIDLVEYIDTLRSEYNIKSFDFRINSNPVDAGLYVVAGITLDRNYIPNISTEFFTIRPIKIEPTWDEDLPDNKRIVLKEEGGVDFDFGADDFYANTHDIELDLDIKDETTYTTIYAGVKAATMPDIDFSSNTLLENLKEIIKNNTGLDLDGDNIIEQFITATKNNNGLIYLSKDPCEEAGAYIEMAIFAGNYEAIMTRAYIIERNETSLLLDDITCTYGDDISEVVAKGIAVQANGHNINKDAIIKFVDLPDDTDIQDLIHLDYETLVKKLNILNPFVSDEIPTDAEKYLMVAYYVGNDVYKPTLAIKLLTIHKAKIHVSWDETWANENGGSIGELGYMLTYTYINHEDTIDDKYNISYPSNGIYAKDLENKTIELTIRNIVNDIPECDAGVHGLEFILTGSNADNYRIDNGITDSKYINMLGYTILRKDISIGWKSIEVIKALDNHSDFDGKLSNNDYTLTYTYRGQDDCGVEKYYYIDTNAFAADAEGVTINVYGKSKDAGIHDLVFLATGEYASNYDIENHITGMTDNTLGYEIIAKQLIVGWDEDKIVEPDLIDNDVFKYIYNRQLNYVDDKFKITNPESVLDDGIGVTIVSGRAIEAGKHVLVVRLTGTYANNYYLTKQGLLYLGVDTLDYEILPKPVTITWKDEAGIVEENKLTYIYNGEINYLSNHLDKYMFETTDFLTGDIALVDMISGYEINVGNYEATFGLFGKDAHNYVLVTEKLPYEIVPKQITVEWTKVVFDVASNEIKMPHYEFIGLVKNDLKPLIIFEYYDLDGNEIYRPSSVGTYLAKIVGLNDDNYVAEGETLYVICDFDSLIENPDYDIVAASINDDVLSRDSLVKAKLTECPSYEQAISILSSLDDDTLLKEFTNDEISRVMTLLLEATHLEQDQLDIIKPLVADKYGEGVYNKSFFLSIDLYTMVSGIISKKQVHEPGYDIPVTIKVSKDSEAAKLISGRNKLYYIIRVHNGEVDRIPAKCTRDDNGDYLLSFKSDRFSVYGFYSVDKPQPDSYVVPKTGIR